MINVITAVLLIAGFVIFVASTIGVVRFDDFYKRLHASGMGESFGFILMCLGLIVYEGVSFLSAKILLVVLALFVINTIGTHLIARAAYQSSQSSQGEVSDGEADAVADACEDAVADVMDLAGSEGLGLGEVFDGDERG